MSYKSIISYAIGDQAIHNTINDWWCREIFHSCVSGMVYNSFDHANMYPSPSITSMPKSFRDIAGRMVTGGWSGTQGFYAKLVQTGIVRFFHVETRIQREDLAFFTDGITFEDRVIEFINFYGFDVQITQEVRGEMNSFGRSIERTWIIYDGPDCMLANWAFTQYFRWYHNDHDVARTSLVRIVQEDSFFEQHDDDGDRYCDIEPDSFRLLIQNLPVQMKNFTWLAGSGPINSLRPMSPVFQAQCSDLLVAWNTAFESLPQYQVKS